MAAAAEQGAYDEPGPTNTGAAGLLEETVDVGEEAEDEEEEERPLGGPLVAGAVARVASGPGQTGGPRSEVVRRVA